MRIRSAGSNSGEPATWSDDANRPPALSALGLGALLIALMGLMTFGGVGLYLAAITRGLGGVLEVGGVPIEAVWVVVAVPIGAASFLGGFRVLFGGTRTLATVATALWLTWVIAFTVVEGRTALLLPVCGSAALVLGGVWAERRER